MNDDLKPEWMVKSDRLWTGGAKPDACEGCPWANNRKAFVPGVGDLQTPEIFAVFERPGKHESGECDCQPGRHETLEPLVGPTGWVVESSLGGWGRVYRSNVRKCNGTAKSEEEDAATIKHCTEAYLLRERDLMASLGVKVVLLGGADAAAQFMGDCNMAKQQGAVYTREEMEAIRAAV